MARIAIDVALLPDRAMTELAIARNKQLLTKYPNKIMLNQHTCLPHISLCMGAVEEADVPKITNILQNISKNYQPLTLKATSITVVSPFPNEQFSMFDIASTPELQSLFGAVMGQLRPFLSYNNVTASMFVQPPKVEAISITWVENYSKKLDNPNSFNPHVSLGVGDAGVLNQPVSFSSPILALCQLGNYCTCREVLAAIDLR